MKRRKRFIAIVAGIIALAMILPMLSFLFPSKGAYSAPEYSLSEER